MRKWFTIASLLFGAVAAGLWFWSSMIVIPQPSYDDVGQPGTFLHAIRLSAQINGYAAATTGFSVLMSWCASLVQK